MKKFYYSSCSLAAPHVGIIWDDILASKKNGDTVYLGYCHCALTSCFMNLGGYASICRFCHFMYRQNLKDYGEGVQVFPIHPSDFTCREREFDLHNASDVKAVKYRGVQVGSSVLSMYYDVTRDLDMVNFEGFKKFAVPLMSRLCDFVDYVYTLLDDIRPDQVLIYNGRLYENRLFYDIAKSIGIEFVSLEGVGGHVEPYKRILFKGNLPLNISLYGQMVEELWEKSPLSLENKTREASSFYEKRRNGILVGDTKVYTAMQQDGLLPEGFKQGQRNIVIFNSSQDEIAALGDEWEEDTLFASQYEATEFMLQHADADIHFFLRIHPNLKGITHKGHMELYQLEKYQNITVIPPESEVSSYALMDACDKVVTFGSTTGVEACYWGKPSILIGHSYYEMTDACYRMATREAVISAINENLAPKDRLGALKYAYFLVDRKFAVENSNIDIDVKYRHWRWDFFSTSYFKVFNSKVLFQILYFVNCIVIPKFTKGKSYFPWPKK